MVCLPISFDVEILAHRTLDVKRLKAEMLDMER